ncbi:MAG: alkaline phosphatase family protein [Planctomycetota bacterium]
MPARLLVFGLDGADWDILDPMIEAGLLPAFKALKARSVFGPLESTRPPITAVAWTSSLTGVNPGIHGVQGFFRRGEGGTMPRLIGSGDVKSPTMFRILSDLGRSVCGLNVPFAYPPEAVNGILTSGFGTPSASAGFAHPPGAQDDLVRRFGYQPLLRSAILKHRKPKRFLKDLESFTESHRAAAEALLSERDWDLFFAVFDATDRLQHHFWRHFDPKHPFHPGPAHPFAQIIPDYYVRLDRILAELIERAGPGASVMLYSDHGFGPTWRDVHLNRVLEEAGLLAWRRNPFAAGRLGQVLGRAKSAAKGVLVALRLEEVALRLAGRAREIKRESLGPFDWSRTRAFVPVAFDRSICLNVRGRDPQGIVDPAEARSVLAEVLDLVLSLRDPANGNAPVRAAIPREQAYHGPFTEHAPELLLDFEDGYHAVAGWGPEVFADAGAREGELSGNHRQMGLFALAAPGAKPGPAPRALRIEDVAPTILEALGVSIPAGLDGQSVLGGKSSSPALATPKDPAGGSAYTPEEEAEVKRRLEDLGYL